VTSHAISMEDANTLRTHFLVHLTDTIAVLSLRTGMPDGGYRRR
jgi:hypothetical protein